MSKRVVLVAAVARNRVIGAGPDIPWRIPGEQAEFKRLTMGHVLVMGRTTYESIGRPLPGRTTVVLTRDPSWSADGVLVDISPASIGNIAARVGPTSTPSGVNAVGVGSTLTLSWVPISVESTSAMRLA